ncbi:hypothetical protein B0H17DRAFT_1193734 [Mycena rosella]|uniref:Uncharacterized protein n=1 Tax=Mycena rosella TaxID=1033263 RepID=A0AAD7GSY0_MYCRO|nr:hypothetical protein B0H17DRAFT_1193734 [Mycena rosella]
MPIRIPTRMQSLRVLRPAGGSSGSPYAASTGSRMRARGAHELLEVEGRAKGARTFVREERLVDVRRRARAVRLQAQPEGAVAQLKVKYQSSLRGRLSMASTTYETALAIAPHANLLIITGYNLERLALSEAAIEREVPEGGDALFPKVLIHNAAAPIGPFKVTVDKLKSQTANRSHRTETHTPRVVLLTSIFHEHAQDPAKYERFKAYNQATSAIVLLAAELSCRSGGAINGVIPQ